MKTEKSCGIVIFRQGDHEIEYLLLRSKMHGDWGFPKGHMEGNETEQQTAKREVLEEVGLDIEIIDDFRVVTEYLIKRNINKVVVYFVGNGENQEVQIQASEVKAYMWVNLEKALEQLSYDNLKEIIRKANSFLVTNK